MFVGILVFTVDYDTEEILKEEPFIHVRYSVHVLKNQVRYFMPECIM